MVAFYLTASGLVYKGPVINNGWGGGGRGGGKGGGLQLILSELAAN